ncbi:prepilin peptidase [Brevibacillus fluminis]|uniref:prepilin peptidase n=1 Tax=Brevibacillus fluminis TaxID=511487 RepID=UPI001FE78AF5|nr:A24 family peptidase [Brevibacillus fluminis]
MAPLDLFFTLFFFILGLCFGSFYNVVGLRIPLKQSIVSPPSRCPKCERRLSFLDLLPVAGFLLRRGKCASCKKPIAIMYPLMELLAGILFAFAYLQYKTQPTELLIALLLISLFIIVSVSDTTYRRIPNAVLLTFLPLIVLCRIIWQMDSWYSYLLGGVLGFALLFAIAAIKPGAMGMGDVKLLGVLGFGIGWQNVLLTLFLGSVIGLLVAIVLLVSGKVKWKGAIPFGPSLCAAALLAFFYGDRLLEVYLSLFIQL